MTTILIVDDNADLRDNVREILAANDYQALTAADGLEALERLEAHAIDLILADIAMPRLNGYQLYERVRADPRWVGLPFLFLTARNLDSDIRFGKELGVDDYLTKPVGMEDLLAAVRGKLKRARQLAAARRPAAPDTMVLGRLRIAPAQHAVWLDDEQISLSPLEFRLLLHLGRHAGQIISPPDLIKITHEFEPGAVEAGNLVRPLIRSLRRKLNYGLGEEGCIETVRGVGYRLVPPH